MKRTIIAAAAVALSAGLAQAQSAQQRYQGTFFVTDASDGCKADGGTIASEGDNYVFVFRTDNAVQSMAIYGNRRAMAFVPEGSKFKKAGDHMGTYILAAAVPRQTAGKYSGFKLTPGKFDGGNEAVSVEGKLNGFEGVEGCNISFSAGGVRRPDF